MANMVPKERKSMTERMKTLNTVAQKVNEKAGKKIVGFIGKDPEIMEKLRIKFIKTPSVEVNDAMGGGLPKGRITIISGLSDSGKTSLLLETIAHNQQEDPEFIAAWLESENSLQKEYVCDTFGIDPDRFFFIGHDKKMAGEGAIDLLDSVLEAGVVDMAVVNSLKMLVPSEEFRKSVGDAVVGTQARMNARMMRKITAMVAEEEIALAIVQHLTVDIGSASRDPLVLSGGHAIRFAAAITLDLRKKSIQETDPIKREEGIKVGVTVRKNHCVPDRNPYVKVDYFAIFGQGIERYLPIISKAVTDGVLMQSGAFIRDPDANGDPKVVDGVKYQWQGKEKFRQFLIDNPAYYKELQDRVGGVVEQLSDEEMALLQQDIAAEEELTKTEEKKSKTAKAK